VINSRFTEIKKHQQYVGFIWYKSKNFGQTLENRLFLFPLWSLVLSSNQEGKLWQKSKGLSNGAKGQNGGTVAIERTANAKP